MLSEVDTDDSDDDVDVPDKPMCPGSDDDFLAWRVMTTGNDT